jgi:hypothetical protein
LREYISRLSEIISKNLWKWYIILFIDLRDKRF